MFGELPKLFGRDFAVGYFLPFAAFLAASLGLMAGFGLYSTFVPHLQADILVGTTIFGLISWLGGVLLVAVNRAIVRLFEGYGELNPARPFKWIERRRYQLLRSALSNLDKEYDSCIASKQEFPQQSRSQRNRLMVKAAERFPDQPHLLLPTAFGNTIRAFEVYPRVMYGVEDIYGWNRLLAVIPTDYRELVDTAKAQVDFWVNLRVLGLLTCAEYLGFVLYTGQVRVVGLLVLVVLVLLISISRARSAAVEWGDQVKASFDVFLPALRTTLQFPPQSTMEQERLLWTRFSQAITYRVPSALPDRSLPQSTEKQ